MTNKEKRKRTLEQIRKSLPSDDEIDYSDISELDDNFWKNVKNKVPTIEEIVDSIDMEKVKDPKWNNGFHKLGGIPWIDEKDYESIENSAWFKKLEQSITPAEYIRTNRDKHSMTQKELGDKIGKSKQFISDLESEIISITDDIARKLEDVFKMLDEDSDI